MRALAVAILACGLVLPDAASGHPFNTFGFHPRGVAMGGAMVSEVSGGTASWYNPALLVRSRTLEVEFGFSWATPALDVTLDSGRPLPHEAPPDFGGYSLALTFPLAGKVENRLAIGVSLYLPSQQVLRTEAVDPTTPFWYLYDASPDRLVILPALSLRILDGLSVGVGMQALAILDGGAVVEADAINRTIRRRQLRNDLKAAQAPTVGLAFEPLAGWKLGATYRGALQLDYALPTTVYLTDIGTLFFDIRGVAHFTPDTWVVGTSYRIEAARLTVAAALEYQRWSQAPSPNMQLQVDLGGQLVDAFGLQEALDIAGVDGPPGFADVWVPRLGVEWQTTERFLLRAGYHLRPTFVPDQTGDTTYLDGSTHALAAGLGFLFDDPIEMFAKPLQIDLCYQRQVVRDRTTVKTDGTRFVSGGHVDHVAASIAYRF